MTTASNFNTSIRSGQMQCNWMSPKDYFERIVKPTVEDYWVDKREHRKENAVFQISSFSERYFKYHRERGNTSRILKAAGPKIFGKAVSKICPEYGLLWDAANGAKHQIPDEHTSPEALVTTSTAVWGSVPYVIGGGGPTATIDQAITAVYEFWRNRVSEESE